MANASNPETQRNAALQALALLDTPREPAYDAIVRLMHRNLRAPIASLTFLDGDRSFIKSELGLDQRSLASESDLNSVCVISGEILKVTDATLDPRFSAHALVKGDRHIRSFLGIPVHAPDRIAVGCLAVYDTEVREFDDNDIATMKDLALWVERLAVSNAPDSNDPLKAMLKRRQSDKKGIKGAASRIPISLMTIRLGESDDESLLLSESDAQKTSDLIFAQCRRAGDFVAPSEANEFFVMLPNTDAAGAKCIADRVCNALFDSGLPQCERIAIGGAIVTTPQGFAKGWSAWSDVADRAMFKALEQDEKFNYVAEHI